MAGQRNKVTMSDVARASGVSLSTVSLVLNDRPGLPAETRAKVIRAAWELGYELRASRYALNKLANLETIGILVKRTQDDSVHPSSNIFSSHVIAGIEAACRQENISMLYSTLRVDSNSTSLEIPRLVQDMRIDGLMLVGSFVDERLYTALLQRGVPVVMLESYCDAGEFDSVIIDNTEGTYISVEHLINRGHCHIAFIGSYPDSRISFRFRRQGYQQSLADHGIQPTYYGDCPHNNREAIIQATYQLIRENPQITALCGCNDEVSITAIHGVMRAGKRVPEDISIVGFDNNVNAENAIPPLTTMHVDKVGMGRLAVQLMINRVESPDEGIVTMRAHTRLVERQSVRDLRGNHL